MARIWGEKAIIGSSSLTDLRCENPCCLLARSFVANAARDVWRHLAGNIESRQLVTIFLWLIFKASAVVSLIQNEIILVLISCWRVEIEHYRKSRKTHLWGMVTRPIHFPKSPSTKQKDFDDIRCLNIQKKQIGAFVGFSISCSHDTADSTLNQTWLMTWSCFCTS